MTKNEIKTFIKTLNIDISYTNFRSALSEKLYPLVQPKEYYYKWYGIFKEIKRDKQ
jgi:hypothetical protein